MIQSFRYNAENGKVFILRIGEAVKNSYGQKPDMFCNKSIFFILNFYSNAIQLQICENL
jgi:hypothetical protein